jgi:proteic killer suppression protein
VTFADKGTEDAYNGLDSKVARKSVPADIEAVALRKLQQLDQAQQLSDLAASPGNRLERLSGDRVGQHSIRINDKYRVCFVWTDKGAVDVEVTDYH